MFWELEAMPRWLRASWREIAASPVIASAGVAGGVRAAWWWIIVAALLVTFLQLSSLEERAREVSQQRHGSRPRPKRVEAYAAVIVASFFTHLFLCALTYLFGSGLAWVHWVLWRLMA
jgi:hypothetical protein